MMRLALVLLVVLIVGCPPAESPATESCEAAGARLRELQCFSRDGRPLWQTPAGVPFAVACVTAAEDGRDWHPACLAKVPSCEALDRAYAAKVCPW
jgi:hypothetical protein